MDASITYGLVSGIDIETCFIPWNSQMAQLNGNHKLKLFFDGS